MNVYIADTPILASHPDFGGRATDDYNYYDATGTDSCPTPQDGTGGGGGIHTQPAVDGGLLAETWHGTWLAGLAGGTIYGVAKGVRIHGVAIADCNADADFDAIAAGLEWISQNAQLPAVVVLARDTLAENDAGGTFDAAIDALVEQGITVVGSAGNDGAGGCDYEPDNDPNVITVGGIDQSDALWNGANDNSGDVGSSNWGACVALYAPASLVTSDKDDGTTITQSGTSASSPIVGGRVALYLQSHPTATPAQVKAYVTGDTATYNVLTLRGSSNNILVFSLDNLLAPVMTVGFDMCALTKANARFMAEIPDNAGDASIYELDVSDAGAAWTVMTATSPDFTFPITSGDSYQVRGRYQEFGVYSPYSATSSGVAPTCPGTPIGGTGNQ